MTVSGRLGSFRLDIVIIDKGTVEGNPDKFGLSIGYGSPVKDSMLGLNCDLNP